MIFDLPTSVEFGGESWEINTDYRDILRILLAFDDPELENPEKAAICLYNFYKTPEKIPRELFQAAFDAAIAFIDRDQNDERLGPRMMDWEQDAQLIFPAVNRVAGCEVRSMPYLHWWTFMGYFMEIRDSTASMVFSLRNKKFRGKKLEKWEREYWRQNIGICNLKRKETAEEKAEKERLKELLGG